MVGVTRLIQMAPRKVSDISAFLLCFLFQLSVFCPRVFSVSGISMPFEMARLFRQAWQGTYEDMARFLGQAGDDERKMSKSLRSRRFNGGHPVSELSTHLRSFTFPTAVCMQLIYSSTINASQR